MALSVGCSRCGGTSSRRQQAFKAPSFVPVQIALPRAVRRRLASRTALRRRRRVLLEMASPPGKPGGVIEIEVSGARIRVEPGVELATLSTVLSALRGIR